MSTDTCFFCDLVESGGADRAVVFEDDAVIVMIDDDWAVKGHTLVAWKRHVTNASDLSEDEYVEFSRVVHRVEKALLVELELHRSVLLKSGGFVQHFHFHIYPIPRDTSWKEVDDMINKRTQYKPTPDEKEKFIESLRARLERAYIVSSESFAIARGYLGQEVEVTMDRPLGTAHPKHGFAYECNYGYIAGERAPDGEDLDVYYLGVQEPLITAKGVCIAVAHRRDDDDDKLIVVPQGMEMSDEEIMAAIEFKEKWFDTIIVRL